MSLCVSIPPTSRSASCAIVVMQSLPVEALKVARTAGRADRTVMGPLHRRLFGHTARPVRARTGPRSPGRLVASRAPRTDLPIAGSDQVSETLLTHYQPAITGHDHHHCPIADA